MPLAPPTAISVNEVTAVVGVATVVMPNSPTVVVGGGWYGTTMGISIVVRAMLVDASAITEYALVWMAPSTELALEIAFVTC